MAHVLLWGREEKRNHKFMVFLFKNVVAKELRAVFKEEWNSRYQVRFGSWDDTRASGVQLFHLEKTRSRPNQEDHQNQFEHGDTDQWDCPALFDAILSSYAIGNSHLDPTIMTEIEKLRAIHDQIAYPAAPLPLSNDEFQIMINDVEKSFRALRLPINGIKRVKHRYKSFKILPSRPPKEVVYLPWKIDEKLLQLATLRSNGQNKLTYYYISGNPGSGKTQLARRLCRDSFKGLNWESVTAFVMTLKARDTESLLNSYRSFCQRLNCCEGILENVMNSDQPKEEKVRELRSLIATRIRDWRKWWIIVDNVVDLDMIYPLLPQMDHNDWNNGQIILTVQNATSVPADSSFTKHISIGDGTELRPHRSPRSSLRRFDSFEDFWLPYRWLT